ncbi:hypothetical protein [Inquilinus sp. OTU3971]|uniref:hypothetical protein n=1 Tax=Inquilinus sp. OTU3971 TaxID=3043855 RepID=UPI00313C654A
MAALDVVQWTQLLALGAFSGVLGQGARVVVGLKKVGDTAAAENREISELIVPSRLLISLLIGAIAGGLTAVLTDINIQAVSFNTIAAFAAAGYAGADLIEGLISRILPQPGKSMSGTIQPSVRVEEYLG